MTFSIYKYPRKPARVNGSVCGGFLAVGIVLLTGWVSAQTAMDDDLKQLPDRIESYLFVNLESVSRKDSLLSMLPVEKMTEVEENRFRFNPWSKPVFSSWEAAYKIMVYPDILGRMSSLSVGIWNSPDLYTQRDYVIIRGRFDEVEFVEKLADFGLQPTDQESVYVYPTLRPVNIQLRFVSKEMLILSNDKTWLESVGELSTEEEETLRNTAGRSRFSVTEPFEEGRLDLAFCLDGEIFPRIAGKDNTIKMLLGPLTKSESASFYLLSGEMTSFVSKVSYPDDEIAGLGAGYQRELISLTRIFLQRYQVENQFVGKDKMLEVMESIETTRKGSDIMGRYSLTEEVDSETLVKMVYLLRGHTIRYWQTDKTEN